MQLNHTFTIRLDESRIDRLDQLARVTGRSRGAVVRLLLDAAQVPDRPDIGLGGDLRRRLDERAAAILASGDKERCPF